LPIADKNVTVQAKPPDHRSSEAGVYTLRVTPNDPQTLDPSSASTASKAASKDAAFTFHRCCVTLYASGLETRSLGHSVRSWKKPSASEPSCTVVTLSVAESSLASEEVSEVVTVVMGFKSPFWPKNVTS